jgi:hypothetical protein
VVEDATTKQQGKEHIACFKTWQKSTDLEIGPAMRRKASEMLEDALKMSK